MGLAPDGIVGVGVRVGVRVGVTVGVGVGVIVGVGESPAGGVRVGVGVRVKLGVKTDTSFILFRAFILPWAHKLPVPLILSAFEYKLSLIS